MNKTRTAAVAAAAVTVALTSVAVPAHAAYSGAVTKAECVAVRQHMTKGYVQNTLFKATGIKVADFYARGNHWRTYSYLASKSWRYPGSGNGVGVEYYFSSPDGKWKVSEATCIYIPKLRA